MEQAKLNPLRAKRMKEQYLINVATENDDDEINEWDQRYC